MDRKNDTKPRANAREKDQDLTKGDDAKTNTIVKMIDRETQNNISQEFVHIRKREVTSNNLSQCPKSSTKRKSNTNKREYIASKENADIWEWEICTISDLLMESQGEADKLLEDNEVKPIIVLSETEAEELPMLVIGGKVSETDEEGERSSCGTGASEEEEASRTENEASSRDDASITRTNTQTEHELLKGKGVPGDNRTRETNKKINPQNRNNSTFPKKVVKINRKKVEKIEFGDLEKCCTRKIQNEITKCILGSGKSEPCVKRIQWGTKGFDLVSDSVDSNYEKEETGKKRTGSLIEGSKIMKSHSKKISDKNEEKPGMLNERMMPKDGTSDNDYQEGLSSTDSIATKSGSLERESGMYSMSDVERPENSLTNANKSTMSLKKRSLYSDNFHEATRTMQEGRDDQGRATKASVQETKAREMSREWEEVRRKDMMRRSDCKTATVGEYGKSFVSVKSSLMIARQKLKKSATSWSSTSNKSVAKEPTHLIQDIDSLPLNMKSPFSENVRNSSENVTSLRVAPEHKPDAPQPSLHEDEPSEEILLPCGDHVSERTQGLSSEDEIHSSSQRILLQNKSKVLLKKKKSQTKIKRTIKRKKTWNQTQTKSADVCNELHSETSSESMSRCLQRTSNNVSTSRTHSKILKSSASLNPDAIQHFKQPISKTQTDINLFRPPFQPGFSTSPTDTSTTLNSHLGSVLKGNCGSISKNKTRKRRWRKSRSSLTSTEASEVEQPFHSDSESQEYYSSDTTNNTRKRRRMTSAARAKTLKASVKKSIKSTDSRSETETVLKVVSNVSNKKTKSRSQLSGKSTDSVEGSCKSESRVLQKSSSQVECSYSSAHKGTDPPPPTPTSLKNVSDINKSSSQINCTACSMYEYVNPASLEIEISKSRYSLKLAQKPSSHYQCDQCTITDDLSQSVTERGVSPDQSIYVEHQISEMQGEQSSHHPATSPQTTSAGTLPLYPVTSNCSTQSPDPSVQTNDGSIFQTEYRGSGSSLDRNQFRLPASEILEEPASSSTAISSSPSSDSSGSQAQKWKDLVANSQLRILPSSSHSQSGFRPCSPSCASYEQLRPASREDLLNLPPCKTVRRTRSPTRLPPCINNPRRKRRRVKRVQKKNVADPKTSDAKDSIEMSLSWRDRPVAARDKRRGPYFTLVPFAPGGRLSREGPVVAARGRPSLPPAAIGGGCGSGCPCALAQPRRSYWSQGNSGGTFIGGLAGAFPGGTSGNKDAASEGNVEGDAYDKTGDFNEPWAMIVSTETPSDIWQQLPGGECCCTDEKPEKPGLQVIVSGHALSPETGSNATPSTPQQAPSAAEGSDPEEARRRSSPAAEVDPRGVMRPPDATHRERWLLRALRTFDSWISPRSSTRIRRTRAPSQRIHSAPVVRSPEPLDRRSRRCERPASEEVSRSSTWWHKMTRAIFRDKCKEK